MNQETNQQISNRDKILLVGRSLIAEKGIKETSLAEIAKAAGISKGTLFYYYASKNDLVYDILDQHFSVITNFSDEQYLQESAHLEPAELLRIRFEQLTNDQDINRLNFYLLQEGILGNQVINDRFIERYRTWRKSIGEAAAKVFGISDPETLATVGTIILAVIDGLTLQKLIEPNSVDMKKVTSQLVKMIK